MGEPDAEAKEMARLMRSMTNKKPSLVAVQKKPSPWSFTRPDAPEKKPLALASPRAPDSHAKTSQPAKSPSSSSSPSPSPQQTKTVTPSPSPSPQPTKSSTSGARPLTTTSTSKTPSSSAPPPVPVPTPFSLSASPRAPGSSLSSKKNREAPVPFPAPQFVIKLAGEDAPEGSEVEVSTDFSDPTLLGRFNERLGHILNQSVSRRAATVYEDYNLGRVFVTAESFNPIRFATSLEHLNEAVNISKGEQRNLKVGNVVDIGLEPGTFPFTLVDRRGHGGSEADYMRKALRMLGVSKEKVEALLAVGVVSFEVLQQRLPTLVKNYETRLPREIFSFLNDTAVRKMSKLYMALEQRGLQHYWADFRQVGLTVEGVCAEFNWNREEFVKEYGVEEEDIPLFEEISSIFTASDLIVLSFSEETERHASTIATRLEKLGYHVHNAFETGEEVSDETMGFISSCAVLSPFLTTAYQNIGSRHPEIAWELDKSIIPLKFEDYEPEVGSCPMVDFTNNIFFEVSLMNYIDQLNSAFSKIYYV